MALVCLAQQTGASRFQSNGSEGLSGVVNALYIMWMAMIFASKAVQKSHKNLFPMTWQTSRDGEKHPVVCNRTCEASVVSDVNMHV